MAAFLGEAGLGDLCRNGDAENCGPTNGARRIDFVLASPEFSGAIRRVFEAPLAPGLSYSDHVGLAADLRRAAGRGVSFSARGGR